MPYLFHYFFNRLKQLNTILIHLTHDEHYLIKFAQTLIVEKRFKTSKFRSPRLFDIEQYVLYYEGKFALNVFLTCLTLMRQKFWRTVESRSVTDSNRMLTSKFKSQKSISWFKNIKYQPDIGRQKKTHNWRNIINQANKERFLSMLYAYGKQGNLRSRGEGLIYMLYLGLSHIMHFIQQNTKRNSEK